MSRYASKVFLVRKLSFNEQRETGEYMMSYDEILLKAWKKVLKDYDDNVIDFGTGTECEPTLLSHLFAECLRILKEERFETPLQIIVEREFYPNSGGWIRTDLVLGKNEVVVELKVGKSQSVPSEIKHSLEKLDSYKEKVKCVYLLGLDNQPRRYLLRNIKQAGIQPQVEDHRRRDGSQYAALLVKK